MTNETPYVRFSQREGLEPLPPQMKTGQVSDDLKRQILYYFGLEIGRNQRLGFEHYYLLEPWLRVATDLHVLFLGLDISTFNNRSDFITVIAKRLVAANDIGKLFNFIEFLVRHPLVSAAFKKDITGAFISTKMAYRIVDKQIISIGVDEQADAFERALATTEKQGALAARKQLVAAGRALRDGDWPGSIRESIHAVEAMAVRLAPETRTLGPALTAIEQRGHLHGSLKKAFGALYGYSSDEEGVRHALVLNDAPQVDEADALFMLGACASFVSYLIVREGD